MKVFVQKMLLSCALLLAFNINAQVQISGGSSAAGSYPTLSAAITALNAGGALTAPVVVDVAANHSETLTGKITLTASGTVANTITIQKSGAGANPILYSYIGTATTPSVIADGFFVLAGSDYVTIDGIDLQESAGNTTTATVMEFGYGLFKTSVTDGCQNNTIKNCTITLNRIQNTTWTTPGHNGSCGITVLNALHTATGALTITAASGSNSNNKFYSNTIQNCNAGISIVGFAAASPFTLGDTNNDIGGIAYATGNTILNFGGGATTNPATGIFVNNQWGLNCSYNTINNNNGAGINHASTLRGIFLNSSSTSASVNCNYNIITIKGGATTSQVTGIESVFGSTAASNTVNLNNNIVTGTYLTATSGAFYGIWNSASPAILNMNNNDVSNIQYSAAALAGSGIIYPIYNSGTATTVNIRNNTVRNIERIGTTGGTMIGVFCSSGTTQNVSKNTVKNLSISGSGTTSTLYGIQTSGTTIVCDSNTVDSVRCLKTTGTGVLYGIYNIGAPNNENYNYNSVSNIFHAGTGTTYGMYFNTTTGTRSVLGNTVFNVESGGVTVAGILSLLSSPTIAKNKVYDIKTNNTGNATVSGIGLTSVSTSGTATIRNNIIGRVFAPSANTTTPTTSPSVRGLNLAISTASSNLVVYNNTVALDAVSTGANFGTAGVFHTASATTTTANLDLRNNIIINNSIPNGTGKTVALHRSSAALENLSFNTNNNLHYAGFASVNNLLYYDGTNADDLLSAYKTRVSPRETAAVTENAPMLNTTTGSTADFLHIDPAVGTQVESGGVMLASVADDFDGNPRFGAAGYAGAGSAPDMGADEGDFTLVDLTAPIISNVVALGNACNTVSRNVTATISDATGVPTTGALMPRIYFRKNGGAYSSVAGTMSSGSNKNGSWTFTMNFATIGGVVLGDIIEYYLIAQDISPLANIASIPSGVVASDVNTVTTHPTASTYTQSNFIAGTYTVGSSGNFTTLSAAVSAYNNSCLNGPVVFQLTDLQYADANYTILKNDDASATNTLTIYPTNAGTVISDTSANPTIILSGAKHVTIDGRPNAAGGFASGTNLVINNTKGTAQAIRFVNEAQNNTVKYADVQSNNSNTAAASAGVIFFGTTTGTNGNDNNTIDFCDIHNITGGNPVVAINANGTVVTAAHNNENNTISNCNIYDYFHATSAYSGILVNGGNSAWTIHNNHFYQTDVRTVTGTGFNKDIFLNNLTGNATGSGFVITNNYIGGNNASGTGTYTLTGTSSHQYSAIYCAVGVGTPTSVQNNTVTNIAFTSGNTSASAMTGIASNGGTVNIGTVTGNLIGAADTDASVSPAITYTNTSTTTGGFIPIFAQATNNAALSITNISNNTIAGIAVNANNANGTSAVDFNAIGYNNGEVTITNNTIGSTTTPKAIYCSSAGTTTNTNTSRMVGVLISGGASSSKNVNVSNNTIANLYSNHSSPGAPATTGTRGILVVGTLTGNINTTISNNIIRDLTTLSQATTGGAYSAAGGISVSASSIGTIDVTNNTIYNINLAGTATTGSVQVAGMFIGSSASGAAVVRRNNIHSLGLSAQNAAAVITGMDLGSGTWTIENNMIRLGIDGTGADITAPCLVRGITKNVATSKIYHNSIYIGGQNVGATATNTFALVRTGTAVDDWRNNILVNNRSNAATGGKHYAINLNATTTLTLDYNDYFANGTGNVFGFTGSADVTTFVPNWVAGDANSYSFDPQFINATGDATTVNLHINPSIATIIEGTGTAIAAVTNDFDGDTRSGFTPTDMGADAGNFTSLSCSGTPSATTAVLFGNIAPICVSGTKVLSLQGFTPYPGLSLQWQESTTTGGPYTNVAGGTGATSALYTTETLTAPKYYVCAVTCANGGASTASTEVGVTVVNPSVTSTTNGSRCGTGSVALSAVSSAGADLQWFTAATGGSFVGSGATFNTPNISASTDYYVAAINIANNATVTQGAAATTSATYSNPFYSAWSNIHTQHMITAAELAASGMVAGDINSVALDVTAPGTLPMIDFSLKIGTTTATNMSAFVNTGTFSTVYTSASLMPTTGINILTFSTPFNWDGVSNIVLEFCHGNAGSTATMSRTVRADNTSYVSTIKTHIGAATSAATICGDITSNLLTYSLRPQFIFNAKGKVCESARTLVSATVSPAPALTLSPNQIACSSATGTLAVVTGAADFNSFNWSPTTGLYLDNALTIPYTGGTVTNSTVYLSNPTPGSIQYICNALNTTTGCVNSATSTVSYGLTGTATVASQPNECPGTGTVAVNVTGAGTIVNEDFSSGVLPSNMISAGNDFGLVNGRMQFTSAVNSKNGGVLISNPTGIANNDFQIDFDMITTPGTNPVADGFSYSYGPDVVALPTGGGSTVVNTVVTPGTENPENGSGSALKLSFDAYTNGANTNGIYLMYNCPVWNQAPTRWDAGTTSGVIYYDGGTAVPTYTMGATGPNGTASGLGWRATTTTGASTHVTIKINSNGEISMWLNNIQVVFNAPLPASYLTTNKAAWKHAFCARTGGLNQGHYIDNLIIQYNNYYEYSLNGTTWTTNTPISAQPGTYNAQARYINFPACVANLGSVTIDPVTVTANITNTNVCAGATTTLSATPNVFQGSVFQWEASPAGLNTFTPIAGATTATYVETVTASMDYRCVIDCGGGTTFTSNVVSVSAITPQVIATVPGTRCGLGTVDLSATANATSTIQWYAAATGGTALTTGPTYTTPSISTSTTYYVTAKESTCESTPRVAIDAIVTPPDPINVSPDITMCSGTAAQTLSVTSANSNYSYTWNPADGLSTTTGATVSAAPTATTTYSITASDAISGCVNIGTVKVTVNQTPLSPIIVPTISSTPCKTVTKLEGSQSGINRQAQLGTATTTNSTTGVTPYSSFYEGVRLQYLLQASELSALNLVAGPITSIAFNATILGPGTFAQTGYTIKLAPTNDAAFAGAYATTTAPFTTVYGPVNQGAPTLGWNTYTFNTPFTWDGASNIVVEICHDNDISNTCNTCYSTSSTVQHTTTTFNSVYGRYNDNAQACGTNATLTVSSTNRPNMIISQIAPANYEWTPTTGLFTDAATTIPYTGGPAEVLWARPAVNTTYTVTASSTNGCTVNGFDTEDALADARVVELPSLGTSQVTAISSCDDLGWTNYFINGKIFFAINWAPNGTLSVQNTAAKNAATIKSVLDAAIAQAESAAGNKIYTMKRWWNVASPSFTDPVHVRFYHDPAEITQIMNAAGGAGPIFSWFKNNTGAYNPATMVTGSKNGIAGGAITPLTGTIGTDNGVAYVQFDNISSFSGGTGAATTQEAALRLNAKVFLSHADPNTGLMDDYVKSLSSFPNIDPYSTMFSSSFTHVANPTTASTTPLVLAATGNNAIVDWVFLELRDGASGFTTVTQTRAALLQKDGDIVDVDGVSPVSFFGFPQNRYVAIRHRNHTGLRTDNLVSLSPTATSLNFTNNSTPSYGSFPYIQNGAIYTMNGGDANSDGSIDAFDTITWEIQNGLFDDYTNNSDYNMDGSVDAFDSITWELNNGKYQELD